MIKKVGLLFVVISCQWLLTGCWDRNELDELAIAVGMGIDQVDNQLMVSIQAVIPGEVVAGKESTGRTPVVTYKATGKTVFEALRKILLFSP